MRFKRDWVLPGGETISPEFQVSIPSPGESPLHWMAIQYRNPELYRRPEFVHHRNSASGLSAVLAVSDQPRSIAEQYAALWRADVIEERPGVIRIKLRHVDLLLLSTEAARAAFPDVVPPLMNAAARYFGFVITVSDVNALRSALESGGQAYSIDALGNIWLPPSTMHGCVVQFQSGSGPAGLPAL
jgi:hypothetical protein